jgi:hypothetical protein
VLVRLAVAFGERVLRLGRGASAGALEMRVVVPRRVERLDRPAVLGERLGDPVLDVALVAGLREVERRPAELVAELVQQLLGGGEAERDGAVAAAPAGAGERVVEVARLVVVQEVVGQRPQVGASCCSSVSGSVMAG